MKVKGISIRQPYAWLVASGLKPIENRSQNTRYRGRLLILASQKRARRVAALQRGNSDAAANGRDHRRG